MHAECTRHVDIQRSVKVAMQEGAGIVVLEKNTGHGADKTGVAIKRHADQRSNTTTGY
jgi:hypothetical protein